MKIINEVIKILLGTTLLISCTKDAIQPRTNITIPSSPLTGQEFIFDSLSWRYYNSGNGSPSWDEIYLSTPSRSDLFVNPYLAAKVFLKLDTSSQWMELKPDELYDAALPVQYLFHVYAPYLVINVWPLDHHLVGRMSALKVKFL